MNLLKQRQSELEKWLTVWNVYEMLNEYLAAHDLPPVSSNTIWRWMAAASDDGSVYVGKISKNMVIHVDDLNTFLSPHEDRIMCRKSKRKALLKERV